MNISSLPIATNPTVSSPAIGTAVMALSLDTAKTAGDSMIKMMEQSVNPSLGKNVDLRV